MRKLKEYIKNLKSSGLVLIDQGLVSGTSFLTGILLTRFLGLNEYGKFVLLWMVILFGLSIAQALVTKPFLSMAPKMEGQEAGKYLRALHGFQLMLSLLASLISIIALTLLSQFELFMVFNLSTIVGLSVALGLILLYDFYRKYFFYKNDLYTPLVTDGILTLFQLCGIVVLYVMDLLSISNFLFLIAFNYFIVCIIGYAKNVKPELGNAAVSKILQTHFDFSKWLLGTVMAQWLSGNFFIICAGGILGTAAVGAIRIAQNVIGLTHVIFIAMENVVPVHAAVAFKDGGTSKLYTFLKKISVRIGWLVMLILILIAFFSPNILGILYGSEYVVHSYVLIGFCMIYLLVYIGFPLRFALRTLELTRPIFIAHITSAIFSVLAASMMIHQWGIYGLLIGLFATHIITLSIYVFSLLKIKKYYESHSLGAR